MVLKTSLLTINVKSSYELRGTFIIEEISRFILDQQMEELQHGAMMNGLQLVQKNSFGLPLF